MSGSRISQKFSACAAENRPALAAYFMGGDPDYQTSLDIMKAMPAAGADIIELGMPFSDPMADGPAIQAAGLRALKGGQTLIKTLAMAKSFRETDQTTPIVLMGYYNPIYIHGVERFVADAADAGIDGLIIVDLPAEEDDELCLPAQTAGISFIRLITPTTDDRRMPTVLRNTSGFVYYVTMTGITGATLGNADSVGDAVKRIKTYTDLPVVVGFGIKTADNAAAAGKHADGVAVGTALVNAVGDSLKHGKATDATPKDILTLTSSLAEGCKRARV